MNSEAILSVLAVLGVLGVLGGLPVQFCRWLNQMARVWLGKAFICCWLALAGRQHHLQLVVTHPGVCVCFTCT